jgi:hypothetical protein
MRRLLKQPFKQPIIRGATLLAGFFISTGFLLNLNHHLFMPGDVSAVERRGEPLSGYESHAMFEQECTFCHAPLHCVTADRCQDCHVEIAEQRSEAIGLHGLLPGTTRCQTCHIEHQGRDAVISQVAFTNIGHEPLAGFSLDKHETGYDGQTLHCENCHTQGRFGADTVDCFSCHEEHDPQLMAEHETLYGRDCLVCHDGHDKMATFDHNQIYPLADGHADVACVDCHQDHQYTDLHDECAACHEADDLHTQTFGTDCARCHAADAWSPAQLTQHTFNLDHGDEGTLDCQSCHIENYYEPTCLECHEAEQNALDHPDENPLAIENCADCHPTGAAGEAERRGQELIQING